MNRWYSLSLAAFLFVGANGLQAAVAADASGTPAAHMNLDELKARLNLTPEQQAQIAPLAEERRSRLEGTGSSHGSSAAPASASMRRVVPRRPYKNFTVVPIFWRPWCVRTCPPSSVDFLR